MVSCAYTLGLPDYRINIERSVIRNILLERRDIGRKSVVGVIGPELYIGATGWAYSRNRYEASSHKCPNHTTWTPLGYSRGRLHRLVSTPLFPNPVSSRSGNG